MKDKILGVVLALTLFVAAVGSEDAPLCATCRRTSGKGFHPHETHCAAFYHCERSYRFPSGYTRHLKCCKNGTVWNQRDFTCVHPGDHPEVIVDRDCDEAYFNDCPVPEVVEEEEEGSAEKTCDYLVDPGNPNGFIWPVNGRNYTFNCAPGSTFSEEECECVLAEFPEDGEPSPPCDRILFFSFEENDDSQSCGNYATGYYVFGSPPALINDAICFNGQQFLEFNYLNNWSSGDDVFSLAFWFILHDDSSTVPKGLVSTNCLWETQGSYAEFLVVDGELQAVLGGTEPIPTGEDVDDGVWHHVGVTFGSGEYVLYVDGEDVLATEVPSSSIPRSQTAATLGYVEPDYFLKGCMDDFSFYTRVVSDAEMKAIYNEGRSNGDADAQNNV